MKIPKDSEYCMELYANANPCNKADLDYEADLIKELYPIGDDVSYVRRALRHIFQVTRQCSFFSPSSLRIYLG